MATATTSAASEPGSTDTLHANQVQYVPDRCVLPIHAAIGVLSLRYAEMSEASGPLATLLFLLTQRCDRATVMSLNELRVALAERQLDDVRDFLDGTLDSIQSPDDMVDLFLQFEGCINNDTSDTINRWSPLGIFLREVVLAFNTLPFSGIAKLFDDVLQFRAGTLPSAICRPNMLRRFLREKAIDLERFGGESSFSETERLLSDLRGSKQQCLAETYYLGFLNCMFHREFEGAISDLHLFFDLTGYRNQLAVLALALLHFHLGHHPSAHQTLRETIRIAQQNNDKDCLLRALSLLAALVNDSAGHTPLELRFLNGALSALQSDNGSRAPGREAFASVDANNIVALLQARLNGTTSKSSDLWPLIQVGLACVKDAASVSDRDHISAGIQLARSQTWMAFANRHLASIASQCAARFSPESRIRTQAAKALSIIDAVEGMPPSSGNRIGEDRCDSNAIEAWPLHCRMDAVLANIQQLIRERRWHQAWTLSEQLLSDCRRRHSTADVGRILRLQAQIAESASDSLASMPMVLQASHMASEAEAASMPIVLECRLRIASLQLSLDAPELALQTLKHTLSDVLEHLSSESKAQAYLIMAKSILQIWSRTARDAREKRDAALKRAISYLNSARDFCSNGSSLSIEIWYLLSQCWNSARRYDKRDRCAEEFLRCQQIASVL